MSAPLQGEKSVTGPQDEVPSRGLWSWVMPMPGSTHSQIWGLGNLWFLNLESYIAADISSFDPRVPKDWDNTGEMSFLQQDFKYCTLENLIYMCDSFILSHMESF